MQTFLGLSQVQSVDNRGLVTNLWDHGDEYSHDLDNLPLETTDSSDQINELECVSWALEPRWGEVYFYSEYRFF